MDLGVRGVAESMVRLYVDDFEREYHASEGEEVFARNVQETAARPIPTMDEAWVQDVLQPVLYRWGGMQRVLGGIHGWQADIATVLRQDAPLFDQFRVTDLERADLSANASAISACYECFKRVLRVTAAGKALHLIVPSFFPLWDTDIRSAVYAQVAARGKFPRGEADTATHYLRFVEIMQHLLRLYSPVLQELADRYSRSKLKILDEFMWRLTHRPLSPFLQ